MIWAQDLYFQRPITNTELCSFTKKQKELLGEKNLCESEFSVSECTSSSSL